jgi:hypothetical protein
MLRFGRVVVLLLVLHGCGGSASSHASAVHVSKKTDAGQPDRALDSDGDGLCDTTEQQVGTDPHMKDSDGDGLPDLIELANGFDPNNRADPGVDQLAYLQAKLGAATDFPVRATFDGDGGGVSGYFDALPSIYSDLSTAQDFYRGTTAVSADPVDAVRSIDSESARFAAVLGHTRLGFSLHFEYLADSPPVTCARAYPFRYSLKADNGDVSGDRMFLLIVSQEAAGATDLDYCLPVGCQ